MIKYKCPACKLGIETDDFMGCKVEHCVACGTPNRVPPNKEQKKVIREREKAIKRAAKQEKKAAKQEEKERQRQEQERQRQIEQARLAEQQRREEEMWKRASVVSVAGVTFDDEKTGISRQKYIKKLCEVDLPITLKREPKNKHDRNAIAVFLGKYQLGYVPSFYAEELAPIMDAGRQYVSRIHRVFVIEDEGVYGVEIAIVDPSAA